jgi:hypothetical protein
MKAPRFPLVAGAIGSFFIAVLHLVIIFLGAPGYRYFGAPDLAVLAKRGSLTPVLVTSGIVLVFTVWGFFALSGAGLVRPFPFLRTSLSLIAAAYTLRGLLLIPELSRLLSGALLAPRAAVFSAVSLCIGLAHFTGLFTLVRQRPSHESRAA